MGKVNDLSENEKEKFTLSLRFRHPDADLSEVARELSLTPTVQWSAGERIKTRSGAVMESTRSGSYLSCRLVLSADITLLNALLERSISQLQRHMVYIHSFVEGGGEIEFLIGWFFDSTGGLEINSHVLGELGSFRIRLALMAYGAPESSSDNLDNRGFPTESRQSN